ncbi:hypothetical protein SUGI_0642730 [Cryptomeria japonica]|uniref:UNC93-like protein 1 n=1 Tax=Cryptomeria japonica TaxID=3369 RepID=UPI0024148009|nr:UNC93-like protein 1 [Cryptomeria japonica]GLJ31933.1 hypothetical protein SUGI_0642730 [Cryptomeria japonica]
MDGTKRGCLQPRYNSPVVQVGLIGVVCFCCPGMFSALSGLGGGGQVEHTVANNANTALYTTFAVFGILGGGIYNILGPHMTLFTGCCTYVLYAASFMYYNHMHTSAFVIIAGALLGVGAGLLWAGQGAIMTSYPTQDRKGVYISLFWSVFSFGGVVGGFIPFILNYSSTNASVNDGTYIAFMSFMAFGTILTLGLLHPDRVIRDDGSKVTLVKYSDVWIEACEIMKLFKNRNMLLLTPACWASNFFITYQFNNVNGLIFNVRTRGFSNAFYCVAQILGSIGIGYVLDFSCKCRRKRGFIGLGIVALMGTAIWGGGLASQLKYDSNKSAMNDLDFKNSGSAYAEPFVLYFCYGLLDAMFQTLCYWTIGALADDSHTLSRYSGFYKGVQSAGAAVAWHIDSQKTSLLAQLLINWGLASLSYPLVFLVILLSVTDGTSKQEIEENGLEQPARINFSMISLETKFTIDQQILCSL